MICVRLYFDRECSCNRVVYDVNMWAYLGLRVLNLMGAILP